MRGSSLRAKVAKRGDFGTWRSTSAPEGCVCSFGMAEVDVLLCKMAISGENEVWRPEGLGRGDLHCLRAELGVRKMGGKEKVM